jgi:hypothetical protein
MTDDNNSTNIQREFAERSAGLAMGNTDHFADGTPISVLDTVSTEELAAEITRREHAAMIFWYDKGVKTVGEDVVNQFIEDHPELPEHLIEEVKGRVGDRLEYPEMKGMVIGIDWNDAPAMMAGVNDRVRDHWVRLQSSQLLGGTTSGFFETEFGGAVCINKNEQGLGPFAGPER